MPLRRQSFARSLRIFRPAFTGVGRRAFTMVIAAAGHLLTSFMRTAGSRLVRRCFAATVYSCRWTLYWTTLKRRELPTVDVLVPSYNESPAILEATLLAALQMRYPEEKRKVYLCDDGGTDQKCSTGTPEAQAAARERRQELTELCAKLGAYYLTRPKPKVLVSGHLRRGVVRRFPGDGRDRRACACFSKILPRFRSWPARIKENLCNFWNR